MPKAQYWKHTFPESTCHDAQRLIPTRETSKHRGAVACKRCLDWLDHAENVSPTGTPDSPGQTRPRTRHFTEESDIPMTNTNTLPAATAAADEIISTHQFASTTVVSGADGTHTLRSLLTAAVEADRKTRADNAHVIADRVVYVNYGPEGDIEAFREAEAIATLGTGVGAVDTKALLAGALSLGHLDADGILAMMKEVAR